MNRAFMFLGVLIVAATAAAQDDAAYRRVIETGAPLRPYFEQWNRGELRWEKADHTKTFYAHLESLSNEKPRSWLIARRRAWDALPNTLPKPIPLAPESELMIICYFAQNAREFNADRDTPALQSKLYAVLSLSQLHAERQVNRKVIEPASVFVAFSTFWTGLWPLCPTKTEPLPMQE